MKLAGGSEAKRPFEERKKRLEGLSKGDYMEIDGQTLLFERVDNPYFPNHIFAKTLEGRPVVIRFIDIESGVVDWPLVPSLEEVGFRFENQDWREVHDLVASCETDEARQEIGREIFEAICHGKESAAIVLQDIILHIVRRITSDSSLDLQEIDAIAARGDEGIFAAEQSVKLIGKQFERIRSFVDAIRRIGNKPTSMIDAGCGASAVLGMAGALFHQATVDAIEINQFSAKCAESVVSFFGLQERIRIVTGDATKMDFGSRRFDALLTETWCAGLFGEKALQIVTRLNRFLSESGCVVPASVNVGIAVDVNGSGVIRWDKFNGSKIALKRIDLKSVRETRVEGMVTLPLLHKLPDHLDILAFIELIDASGVAMLKGDDEPTITMPILIKRVSGTAIMFSGMLREDAPIRAYVSYEAGSMPGTARVHLR